MKKITEHQIMMSIMSHKRKLSNREHQIFISTIRMMMVHCIERIP